MSPTAILYAAAGAILLIGLITTTVAYVTKKRYYAAKRKEANDQLVAEAHRTVRDLSVLYTDSDVILAVARLSNALNEVEYRRDFG